MKIKGLVLFLLVLGFNTSIISCESSTDAMVEEQEETGEETGEEQVDESLNLSTTIPIGVNSWVINSVTQDELVVSDSGIHNWTELTDVIRTFVHTGSGELHVGLNIKAGDGDSKIKITVGDKTVELDVDNTDYEIIEVGKFNVTSGYNYIEIQGLEKSGTFIGDINDLRIGGSATSQGVDYVPLSNPHFGRRGPSVHFRYTQPSGKDTRWYYNEVTVAPGEDILGSFFMVNGHKDGYFGMQVNSESERRVLFSIWSAFETDNPDEIPDDAKVINLGNGNGVTVQDFGNEGSGKQSFIDVGWKTGVTYKFLLKGEPSDQAVGSTDYTAYFYDPEVGVWQLIASLRRPQTSNYIENTHSFLENFRESTGHLTREVAFGNQWVYTTDGVWSEMTNGFYTADATAARDERLDYAGGVNGDKFFLKNCGFFNESVTPSTSFSRASSGTAPNIDFASLPQPTPPAPPAEVTFLERTGWVLSSFSSEETSGEGATGRAADVLDGDDTTYWHSCWSCSPAAQYPHELVIDMQSELTVDGVAFTQRTTLSRAVSDIEILVSSDNMNFESLGNFVLANKSDQQNIQFSESKVFRYIKIVSKSAHDGQQFAALAEIEPFIL